MMGASRARAVGAGRADTVGARVGAAMAVLVAWVMLASGVAWARDAQPLTRIPLGPLGYQAMVPELLLAGSSMLTVDFVDANHLLITFGLRQLMKREPDSLPDDDDRMVGAALVELPSGKVLARTEWRLHDRGQYLWSLGHGRFLLRVRDQMMVIAPMAAVGSGNAFREVPLLRTDRHVVALLVSSDDDLLTVETTKRAPDAGLASDVILVDPTLQNSAQADPAPVQINFYRLTSTGDSAEDLVPISAGAVLARATVDIPMTTGGFLEVKAGGKDQWLFDFDSHSGKSSEVGSLDTSCSPHTTFVGHGEFVAFGCRGSDDRQEMAGFNLNGEEMWQQNFSDTHVSATFAFAAAAGRFALGRIIVSGAFDPDGSLPESVVNSQEVRVVQSYNGKLLFRTDCSPEERAGQNFALSPDGLQLAVVRERTVHHPATKDYAEYSERETAVEVYALPALTEADRLAEKQAEAMAPQDTGARIDLSLDRAATSAGGDAAREDASSSARSISSADAVDSKAGGTSTTAGDSVPTATRKQPTLYGPDERPTGQSPQ